MVAGLIALLALPVAVLAAEGETAAQQAGWQERLDKAAAMQAASQKQQAEADRLLAERNAVCAGKFLINDCRNAASREHVKTTREARRLDNDGKALEREVKKEQLAERKKQEAADAPKREAELQERQAEAAAARQIAAEKIAVSRAGKEKKAAEGEQRRAAAAEKQRRKQAEHDARVARKMREAEQRAAQAAAKK